MKNLLILTVILLGMTFYFSSTREGSRAPEAPELEEDIQPAAEEAPSAAAVPSQRQPSSEIDVKWEVAQAADPEAQEAVAQMLALAEEQSLIENLPTEETAEAADQAR